MFKKVLFATTEPDYIHKYLIPYLEYFYRLGWEVHVLTEGAFESPFVSKVHEISWEKDLVSVKNINIVRQVRRILKDEKYDLMTTYTRVAGFTTRMATWFFGFNKPKIVYTVDGYRFLYQPFTGEERRDLQEQKLCALQTDMLITMNETDYALADNHQLTGDHLIKIPGMGLAGRYSDMHKLDRQLLREEYSIRPEDTVLLYIADFTADANHEFIIYALSSLNRQDRSMRIILAGNYGERLSYCKNLIEERELEEQFIVFESDKNKLELYAMADIFVNPSVIESLPVNVMEAMEYGVPLMVSSVKGNIDLIRNDYNGVVFEVWNVPDFVGKLYTLLRERERMKRYARVAQTNITPYYLPEVREKVCGFYLELVRKKPILQNIVDFSTGLTQEEDKQSEGDPRKKHPKKRRGFFRRLLFGEGPEAEEQEQAPSPKGTEEDSKDREE